MIRKFSQILPEISINLSSEKYLNFLINSLKSTNGKCLIIGAGDSSSLKKKLLDYFSQIIATDVVRGYDIDIVCDGHNLPFTDNSFDCVIIIAVLEHVLEPSKVILEIERVLKKDGIVLADTPFMQQVHMGSFDFTRFTDLGYRWLFKDFTEISRGISVGPASAVAWSLMYFLTSFAWGKKSYFALKIISRILFFWLKYFDYFLINRKGSFDCASSFYFIGKNEKKQIVWEKDLINSFRGLNR